MFLKIKTMCDYSYDYFKNVVKVSETESGLDLVVTDDITVPAKTNGFKIDLKIQCEPVFEDGVVRGYYLYPRSSMGSKTPLRMANSLGVIDSSYRGNIMACVDNVSDEDYKVTQGTRLFQLCSPDLSPVKFSLVEEDELSKTERGDGGFGSTGLYAQANFEIPKQFESLFK